MNSALSKLIVISAVALMTQSASAAERIMHGNHQLGAAGVSGGARLYDANLRSVVYNPPHPGPDTATFGELSAPNQSKGVVGKFTTTLLITGVSGAPGLGKATFELMQPRPVALASDPNMEVFPAWTAVAASVPEPFAMLLLVTGLAAVAWRAGRRLR